VFGTSQIELGGAGRGAQEHFKYFNVHVRTAHFEALDPCLGL
jgi:hypothetical protein